MTRVTLLVAVLMLGYLAGNAGLPGLVRAQAPAAAGQGARGGRGPVPATNMFLVTGTPETRMQLGKAVLFTREQQNAARSHIQWAPEFRFTATLRPPAAAGQEPTTGEMHTDNTQVYLVTGGSGSVLVEGSVDPAADYLVAPGEHRGGPIVGGRIVKVKVGDLLSLPPYTWHTAYGDPGIPLQYVIIHINTRQTIP